MELAQGLKKKTSELSPPVENQWFFGGAFHYYGVKKFLALCGFRMNSRDNLKFLEDNVEKMHYSGCVSTRRCTNPQIHIIRELFSSQAVGHFGVASIPSRLDPYWKCEGHYQKRLQKKQLTGEVWRKRCLKFEKKLMPKQSDISTIHLEKQLCVSFTIVGPTRMYSQLQLWICRLSQIYKVQNKYCALI